MVGQQKRTYLVYSRGLLPDDLRLGNLYLDPANPLDGERKRFESSLEQSVLSTWTGPAEIESPLELAFTSSRQWLINSGLFSLIKGEIGREKSHEVKVSGASGRRLQIKRPESFLNEVVLKSPAARTWLANQLSVSRYAYYLNRATLNQASLPRIWLVTGIQYITDADVVATQTQSKKLSSSVNVPVTPEPVAAAVMLLSGEGGVSGGFENNTKDQTSSTSHHKDERAWAAQFTQLSVQFSPKSVSGSDLPTRIPLHDLVDLKSGGVRAEDLPEGHSLAEEAVDINLVDAEDVHGEELLALMQDADWAQLDSLLDTTN